MVIYWDKMNKSKDFEQLLALQFLKDGAEIDSNFVYFSFTASFLMAVLCVAMTHLSLFNKLHFFVAYGMAVLCIGCAPFISKMVQLNRMHDKVESTITNACLLKQELNKVDLDNEEKIFKILYGNETPTEFKTPLEIGIVGMIHQLDYLQRIVIDRYACSETCPCPNTVKNVDVEYLWKQVYDDDQPRLNRSSRNWQKIG